MARSKRRTGVHPLSYMGVEATTPPQLIEHSTLEPTAKQSDNIGTIWVKTDTDDVWMLTNTEGGSATWTPLTADQLTVNADTGSATAIDEELNLYGSGVITTGGAADTLEIGMTAAIDGQLIIAGTGIDPAWGTLTSSDGTLTITAGPNTLDVTRTGGGGTTDFITDAGTANSAGGQINILGGTNINTSGAGMTVTVNLDNAVTITGQMTCADLQVTNITAGFLESDGAGNISNSEGTDGQLIIGATGAPGAWADLTSTAGTIQITGGTNTLNIESLADLASPYLYYRVSTGAGGPAGVITDVTNSRDGSNLLLDTCLKVLYSSTTGLDGSWSTEGTLGAGGDTLGSIHSRADGETVCVAVARGAAASFYTHMHSATPGGAYTSYSISASADTFSSVWYGNGYWVITSFQNAATHGIYYTTDPTGAWTFTSAGIPAKALNESVYGNGTWVIVGDDGALAYKTTNPTGAFTTVATTSTGFDNTWGSAIDIKAIAYSDTLTLFCIVGDSGRIATSADGITWTQRNNPQSIEGNIVGIDWDSEEEMFIAYGATDAPIFSYNGINWHELPAVTNGVGIIGVATVTGISLLGNSGHADHNVNR